MNKKRMCSMLQSYFDGQLEEHEMQCLADHCKECAVCKENLRELNAVSEYLQACHASVPDDKTFSQVWEKVEDHLVREQLSLKEVAKSFWESILPNVRLVMRPAIAVAFILFLVMFPILEKRSSQQAFAVEAEINKIEAKSSVMILKTKQKKWTIIWVMPMQSEGGNNEEQKTEY